jgi:radical SAM protein with 4Fe4S-binding SPASM domain
VGRGPTEAFHQPLHRSFVRGTLTCLKPSVLREIINTDFPNVINIEPTNACNLKCVYCPRERAAKGLGFMSWDLYTRIIDEAAGHPRLLMLNFHKDGESFLHPQFFEMIRYAKDRDIAETIHLNTNAVCWNAATIDRILSSGIDDITVSLDAARPETYRRHKKVDCLSLVERNVRSFFMERSRRGRTAPFVRVKIMEFDGISKEEIYEFKRKWEGVADLVQVTGIHDWGGSIADVRATDEKSERRFPCAIMWYSLVINWNGEVTVCSVDWDTTINVGDASRQSLHEIWNSPEIKHARRAQIEARYDHHAVCTHCRVWVSIGDVTEWLRGKKEFYE